MLVLKLAFMLTLALTLVLTSMLALMPALTLTLMLSLEPEPELEPNDSTQRSYNSLNLPPSILNIAPGTPISISLPSSNTATWSKSTNE